MNRKTLAAAFPLTVPVLMGYLAIGMAFGLMLQAEGYGVVWALAMSLTIYAGSGQYLGVSLLAAGASLGQVAFLTLMINFRHLVYGLSMLEKFSRFFNVGRNIDAAVRYQKIRQFFLHFSTCSIYIQHWNYDSIFPGNAFDKRNRFL